MSRLSNHSLFWLCVFLLTAAVAPVIAQEEDAQQMIHGTFLKVKPSMVEEYVQIMKDELIPAYKKSELTWIATWEIWPYGPGATFFFATSVPGFARFDSPHPLSKVMEPEKLQDVISRMTECVESYSTLALTHHRDVGFMGGADPNMAVLWRADLKPGKMAEAMHFLKTEVSPAMKEGGAIHFIVLSTLFGEGPDVLAFTMHESFAELDKGHPIMRTRSPEEARRIMSSTSNYFENTSAVTLRHRGDLSFDESEQ